MRFLALLLPLFFSTTLLAQNALPVISNLRASYPTGGRLLSVTYDVSDAANELLDITMFVTDDAGNTFSLNTTGATGDIGAGIAPGTAKTVVWDATSFVPQLGPILVRVIADDGFQLDIQSIVDQVDSSRLLADLRFIEGVRHRTANPTHLRAIKDSIERRFRIAGLATSRQEFPFNSFTGQNIIGLKTGTTHADTAYIINGHFDTVNDSPGADDNGSSVAAVMEIARILAPYRFKKSLQFIQFDLEEAGLVGSVHYADKSVPNPGLIKGMFNLESIGYFTNQPNTQTVPAGFNLLYPEIYAELVADQFRGNYITNIGDQNSRALMGAYSGSAARYVPDLKTVSFAAPLNWQALTPDLGRSDHAPFWLKQIPAVMITGGGNFRSPHYHQSSDVSSTLDFTFMSNVVKAVVGAIAEEAGLQHSSEASVRIEVTVALENALSRTLVVSPVPASGVLQLDFGDLDLAPVQVQLYNAAGQLVLDKGVAPRGDRKVRLDIEGMSAGVYSVVVRSGDLSTSREVVVE